MLPIIINKEKTMNTIIRKSLLISQLVCITILNAHQNLSIPQMQSSIEYLPWRELYNNQLTKQPTIQKQCVFCTLPQMDHYAENYIVYRGCYNYVMLNKQPYTKKGPHFLVIPYQHGKDLTSLSDDALAEIDTITQKICTLFSPESYEIHINYNIGSSANASIPEHLHQHIICFETPRYYNLIDAIENSTNPIDNEIQYNQLKPLLTLEKTTTINDLPNIDNSCYYCSIMHEHDDQRNLIVHRGNHATILFHHYPFCPGEIIIIPNNHYESIEHMPKHVLQEIRLFTMIVYPHILSLTETIDANLGIISYGKKASDKHHITYHIIPRKGLPLISPIMHTYHIDKNIPDLYNKLVNALNSTIKTNP